MRTRWRDRPWPWMAIALVILVVAVRMLSLATRGLAPWLESWLGTALEAPWNSVGAAWLAAYAVLNGSMVADIAATFYDAGIVSGLGFLLQVIGSRLGAAGIIVVLGALTALRAGGTTLRQATRLGTLTFLVGATVYVPLALVGIAIHPLLVTPRNAVSTGPGTAPPLADVAWFLLALALLWLSLWLLEQGARRADLDRIRRRWGHHLQNHWIGAGLGLVVTAFTASIVLSIGALLPLYQRDVIRRREMVAYIFGAHIGTHSDTFLVVAALGSIDGLLLMSILAAASGAVTVVALILFRPYYAILHAVQERVIASPRVFGVLAVGMVAVPVVLVLV